MSTASVRRSSVHLIQETSSNLQEEPPHRFINPPPPPLRNERSSSHNSIHSYKRSANLQRRNKNQALKKRGGKDWHNGFYKYWTADDRPLCQSRKEYLSQLSSDSENEEDNASIITGKDEDLLYTFLGEWDHSIPSWEAKMLRNFCSSDNTQTVVAQDSETWAWVDDREFRSGRSRSYPQRLSAPDLCKILQQKRYGEPAMPDADRRLIYVSKLTPAFILALVETAWSHQVQAVRDAVCKHIAIDTSFRVHIPMSGFLVFHLEFHLAHLILRNADDMVHQGIVDGDQKTQSVANLDFLSLDTAPGHSSSNIVYQAHISVVVCGWSNNQWTGFAFVNTGLPELDDEPTEEDEPRHDLFAADREDDFFKDADMPTWDARKYWLEIVAVRCELILKEWLYLVRSVEEGIESSKAKDPCNNGIAQASLNPKDIQKSLDWTIQTTRLLRKLRDSLSSTLRAYRRFAEPGGDIDYFSDVSECFTLKNSIKETFEKLADLYAILKSLDESCTRFATHLGRILSSESNRLTAESNELNKHSNQLNIESVKLNEESRNLNVRASALNDKLRELNEKSTDAACANLAAAAKTSRSTRVNVELLLFTTPFGMVLQYFGSDIQVFSINRSPTTFVIATLILMLVLRILTLLLEHADALFKFIVPRQLTRPKPQDPVDDSRAVELVPVQPV